MQRASCDEYAVIRTVFDSEVSRDSCAEALARPISHQPPTSIFP